MEILFYGTLDLFLHRMGKFDFMKLIFSVLFQISQVFKLFLVEISSNFLLTHQSSIYIKSYGFYALTTIHVVTFTLISNLATDYIQKRSLDTNVEVITWIGH